ncbi:exodeoxyribonuclease VII small subunit [Gilvimarinus xylanilyticus]|uniref:Exodeoxyribonuclease 7 small subunit n=1 Tax=Gilvimarinus xylanilyticus TaxID=2944139 RepID=A0A9X2KTZ2_9GAMM|nr:exodeoxyribonuclease VII small subunit [Gilvimarinus xylanilyticus]MCP8899804.1 exodeoxyribonuclease VII small subunit [Gilvimarinus xylanilyticus]
MPAKKKSPDLESALTELETLVTRMESGELTLEESLQAFEQGIKLTRECQQKLTQAEQHVQTLIEQNGEPSFTDFEAPDEAQ